MDHDTKDAKVDDPVVWECSLCHNKRRKRGAKAAGKSIYYNQNDFKDHYDRTCHICFSEFTSKISKDQHQVRHSDGISSDCKSLCSLCGKKFKVPINIENDATFGKPYYNKRNDVYLYHRWAGRGKKLEPIFNY